MTGPSPALCAEAAPLLARAVLEYRAAKAAAAAGSTDTPRDQARPSEAEVA